MTNLKLSSEFDSFQLFFKGLANENRQKILFGIFTDKSEHGVQEIAQRLNIANSTASEHLSLLKQAGLLVSEKREKEVYYSIDKQRVQHFLRVIQTWLDCC